MTTASWSTVLDHSSDAGFRAWGSELNAKFAAVGMVQTADTGQINWTTVTRPIANTIAGYEIWKLSGGALYFKFEYGTGGATTAPAVKLTVGTGSNGSGALTGQTSTASLAGMTTTSVTSTVTNYQSYLCATADFLGLAWKLGSSGTTNKSRMFLAVMRTVDSTGAATNVGYFLLLQGTSGTPTAQCVATAAGVTGAQNISAANHFFVPNNVAANPPSSTDGSGNNQAFLWWFSILGTSPVAPLLHAAMILLADLVVGNTASMTLVGTTAHTYINATISSFNDPPGILSAANLACLMLWE